MYISFASFYVEYLDKGIGLYGGLYHATSITHVFHIFIFIISACILQLTGFYPRRLTIIEYSSINKIFSSKFLFNKNKILNIMSEQFKILEYPLMLLFIITGAILLVSTSDLVSIFLSIELQSYGLYLLSTLYRNSESATSAGLTYFLLGGLSSCFILLGTSLLYSNSGTTNLDGLYIITSLSETDSNSDNISIYKSSYVNFSLLILSVGFLFKVSAAPFHFWSPDVYDAIPTIVTTFVAIVAKISIFVFILELVHYTSNYYFDFKYTWTSGLLISSLLSLIIGTILGLSQSRIKRLFAYSTISHVGFILLALSINSIESIQAFVFYLMQYSLANLNAFILLLSIGFSLYFYVNDKEEFNQLIDKNNSPIQLTNQLKGYFYINPVIALSLAITIFSLVGIPPLIGFFAKQMVLSAALDNGYVFITLVAILTSVVSAVYYLGLIKQIFFDKTGYKLNTDMDGLDIPVTIYDKKGTVKFTGPISPIEKNLDLYYDNGDDEDKYDAIDESKTRIYKKDIKQSSFNIKDIILSSSLTITISILTLMILLFMFAAKEWLSMANILAITLFNP